MLVLFRQALLTTLLGFSAVTATDAEPTPPRASAELIEFFETKVRPLLVEHCYQCHSEKAKKVQGGLQLDARALSIKGGDTGAAVVPGKPADC